ncbi:MAG: hypothetical protein RBT64_09290 [Trichloromonas sp.]|jgi:tetratricopeptide (TPR) repeat protein|nr:hypothetical protein [Trichloromonas sp.]
MALRKLAICALLAALLVPTYLWLHEMSWQQRSEVRLAQPPGYTLPSAFGRVLALGFQGLLSDFQFLRTMTFFGDRSVNQQEMSAEDWDYFAHSLEAVTDLDPYFLDPYILGEGLLTWNAQRFEQANTLLEKGIRHRTWDYVLPYYVGFNHFYFLKDYATGSRYIMQAAEIPGSPAYLKTLGARLAYYGGQSQTALLFLKQMLAETHSESLKQTMAQRLLALERAVEIETALAKFRQEQGRDVTALTELADFGYLNALPEDPYGGQWRIMENGRVYSTSKFVEVRPKK